MRIVISLLFLVTSSVLAQPPAPAPAPKTPVKTVPAKITPVQPKAGKMVVVSTEATDPLYDFEGSFAADACRQFGKELAIAIPDSKESKSYPIRLMYIVDGKIQIEKIEIKVAGNDPAPKPAPDEADTLKSLKAEMVNGFNKIDSAIAKMDARIAALEGPRPPPVDPFLDSLKAAYVADGKPAATLSKLISVYRNAPPIVNNADNKTSAAVFKVMRNGMASVLSEPNPDAVTIMVNTRKAIAAELDKFLPLGADSVVPLTNQTRLSIVTQFAKVQKALEGISP